MLPYDVDVTVVVTKFAVAGMNRRRATARMRRCRLLNLCSSRPVASGKMAALVAPARDGVSALTANRVHSHRDDGSAIASCYPVAFTVLVDVREFQDFEKFVSITSQIEPA